jgi:uncharacterized membrane protein
VPFVLAKIMNKTMKIHARINEIISSKNDITKNKAIKSPRAISRLVFGMYVSPHR